IARRQSSIPREALEEAGIDPALLARCRSWKAVRKVHGFEPWYKARVNRARRLWDGSDRRRFEDLWSRVPGVTGRLFRLFFLPRWVAGFEGIYRWELPD